MVYDTMFNLYSCVMILLSFVMYYFLTFRRYNNVFNKSVTYLDISEILNKYRFKGITFYICLILYVVLFIFIYYLVYKGYFDTVDIFDNGFNNTVLVSSSLILSLFAISYSLNDSNYFLIKNKDIVILKNISDNILYLLILYFTIIIIIIFHFLFPKMALKHYILVFSMYILSLIFLIVNEILILIKTYNVYYSTNYNRLKLLDALYYYRFSNLSNNEYSIKDKNYIDGVIYLSRKLYRNLIKFNITDIDIIQPNFGIIDFYNCIDETKR